MTLLLAHPIDQQQRKHIIIIIIIIMLLLSEITCRQKLHPNQN